MSSFSDKNIIDSWLQNAKPWVSAIHNNEIESRILVTNKAIVDVIFTKKPRTALDIGCGEGWLARELNRSGILVHGIDIVPELVHEANRRGGGTFRVLSYQDLSQGAIEEQFDIVVCNFSLIGDESVTNVFKTVSSLLNEDGYFIVQTIHPVAGCGNADYKDGWRKGSWTDFSKSFTDPPPWYFRTLKSWKELFQQNGICLSQIIEPVNPKSKALASIIFVSKIRINDMHAAIR